VGFGCDLEGEGGNLAGRISYVDQMCAVWRVQGLVVRVF
jgi:hypothetical protein